eukprot:COSAG01_NODE_66737_length_269_cov_0.611765_1_plen_57_part_10
MTHIEVKIRELEQASVINLRSHSITTFNRYDRRMDYVFKVDSLRYSRTGTELYGPRA